MLGRRLATLCLPLLAAAVVAGCSTGVSEADRAIFVNACAGASGATQADCACAYDDLADSGGGSGLIQDSIDDLTRGQVPQRVARAIGRCSTP